ncbi:Dosage compensation regulator [Trichinella spiralis]|uniref:Dosage compensation regulator n=1 Tax=Trichinella spiralis TaxID=6334 RepID=A0ABR3KZL8_TRISP
MAVNIKKPIGLTTNIATTSIVDDMIIVAMIIATYMDVGKIVLYHRRRSHVHASAWLSSTHVECNSDQAVKESVANMENVSTVYLVKTGWHPL